MKGWVFLLPTVTASDAKTYFPEHKVCEVPSGKGEAAACCISRGMQTLLCRSSSIISPHPPPTPHAPADYLRLTPAESAGKVPVAAAK